MSTKRAIGVIFCLVAVSLIVAVLGISLATATASASFGGASYTLNNIAPVPYFGDAFDMFYNTWNRSENGGISSARYHNNFDYVDNACVIYDTIDGTDSTARFYFTSRSDNLNVRWGSPLGRPYVGETETGVGYPLDVPAVAVVAPSGTGQWSTYYTNLFDLYFSFDFPDLVTVQGDTPVFTYNLFYFGISPRYINGDSVPGGLVSLTVDILSSDSAPIEGQTPTYSWFENVSISQTSVTSDRASDNYSAHYISHSFSLPYGNQTINNVSYGDIVSYRIKSFNARYAFGEVTFDNANTAVSFGLLGQSAFLSSVPSERASDLSYRGVGQLSYNYHNVQTSLASNWTSTAYNNGYADGIARATNRSFTDGYTDGYNKGSNAGYRQGYTDGVNTSETGTWSNLFSSVFNAPIESVFGKYDPVIGERVGGLLVLDIPLGDSTLNVGYFMMGLLSCLLILCIIKVILRFAL